jgi:hypothetical protein
MKILKERKIGEQFKYRKNIVVVKRNDYRLSILYNKCNICQFKFQSHYKGYLFCREKHRCSSKYRSDKQDIIYKKVKKWKALIT